MRRGLVCLAVALAIGAGCSGKRDPSELLGPTGAGTIVVDARLIVRQAFPRITLSTTQSPDESFDRDRAMLIGATMILTTPGADTVWYADRSDGRYEPYNGTVANRVEPRTTYRLEVRARDGRTVAAATTTPDDFQVRDWLLVDEATLATRQRLAEPSDFDDPDSVYIANQLFYQDGLVEARFDRGSAIGFQMGLFNLENDSPLLIDADFLSDADKASLARATSSPPLEAAEGYVRLPWLAVWYEGRHRFTVYSVDRNWYDLARSANFYGPDNFGFGSNAGDSFDRPIFHIEGGIGLFGSAATDEIRFTVLPRP